MSNQTSAAETFFLLLVLLIVFFGSAVLITIAGSILGFEQTQTVEDEYELSYTAEFVETTSPQDEREVLQFEELNNTERELVEGAFYDDKIKIIEEYDDESNVPNVEIDRVEIVEKDGITWMMRVDGGVEHTEIIEPSLLTMLLSGGITALVGIGMLIHLLRGRISLKLFNKNT